MTAISNSIFMNTHVHGDRVREISNARDISEENVNEGQDLGVSENSQHWDLVREEYGHAHGNQVRRNAVMVSKEFMNKALQKRVRLRKLEQRRIRYRYIFRPECLNCFVNVYIAITLYITAMIFGLCVIAIAHLNNVETFPNMLSYVTFVSLAWLVSMGCTGLCLKLVEIGEDLDEIFI